VLCLALLHQNKAKNDIEFTPPKQRNKGMVISITQKQQKSPKIKFVTSKQRKK
jgi:hypothetical protein